MSNGHAPSISLADPVHRSAPRRLPRLALPWILLGTTLAACNSGPGSGRQAGVTGEMSVKSSGEYFLVDPNEGGAASKFQIAEVFWGRSVDVHGVVKKEPFNTPSDWPVDPVPIFTDFVIGPDIQTDLGGPNYATNPPKYRVETNPVTQRTRLILMEAVPAGLPTPTQPATGNFRRSRFRELLDEAADAIQTVAVKNDDGSSPGPFSVVGRNSILGLRFNDLLFDDQAALDALGETVLVKVGYPPVVPFEARLTFDKHHGALIGPTFHSTRVLIDLTVSESEAAALALSSNAVGLPASLTSSGSPNVSVRIPTTFDVASGQTKLLSSLRGLTLSRNAGGPVASNATKDIVRAMRSGNRDDPNGGFLFDDQPPLVVGRWQATLSNVRENPPVPPGPTIPFQYFVDLAFPSACVDTLHAGEVLEIVLPDMQGRFFEVLADNAPVGGVASDVLVRLAVEEDFDGDGVVEQDPTQDSFQLRLLLQATTLADFLPTYDLLSTAPDACWLSFTPQATFDGGLGLWTDVSTTPVVTVRFTEPMTPDGVTALDSILMLKGPVGTVATPNPPIPAIQQLEMGMGTNVQNMVVGVLQTAGDQREFQFQPSLPLDHVNGTSEDYHVLLDPAQPPSDLVGNPIQIIPQGMGFQIDMGEPTVDTGGIVLRFNSADEAGTVSIDPEDHLFTDLRGQIFYDLGKGTLRPRGVQHVSYPVDQSNPIPSAFFVPALTGLPDPLNPLGSKVQAAWRYMDVGWTLLDESKMNMDVIGLSWVPFGGQVAAEFYEEFEIALSHSSRFPDFVTPFIGSGLLGGPRFFTDNVLNDPRSPQKVVHPRSFGYSVSPVDRFMASSGTTMMPYPFNRTGAPQQSFLWRDTAALSTGDPELATGGVPTAGEVSLGIEAVRGSAYPPGALPTIALPLLMEFRCFPSQTALGLNSIQYLAAPALFRAYSAGGIDNFGNEVVKDPDFELVPDGGFAFNPMATPPVQATASADLGFLQGQLDTVTRVSRAHTIWLDTGNTTLQGPDYVATVIEPDPTEHPTGTSFVIDYRGVTTFDIALASDPFDAASFDPYGNLPGPNTSVNFLGNNNGWSPTIEAIDGARYMQLRLSFVNNVDARVFAEISALGFAFVNN